MNIANEKNKENNNTATSKSVIDLSEKLDSVLFHWIFNDFFTELLFTHGIRLGKFWSLHFADPAEDIAFSQEWGMKAWNWWPWVQWAAFASTGLIVASDIFNNWDTFNTNDWNGNGESDDRNLSLISVVFFRVFGVLILFIPSLIWVIKVWVFRIKATAKETKKATAKETMKETAKETMKDTTKTTMKSTTLGGLMTWFKESSFIPSLLFFLFQAISLVLANFLTVSLKGTFNEAGISMILDVLQKQQE